VGAGCFKATKLTELEKEEAVQLARVAAMLVIKKVTVQLFNVQVQIFVCLIPSFCDLVACLEACCQCWHSFSNKSSAGEERES
jgi:hypothetical protein